MSRLDLDLVESAADRRVDRYEIKLNVVAGDIDKAITEFGLRPEKAKERRIWFGDVLSGEDGRTALPLLGRGVIARVRAKKKPGGDVTLKLRGPDGCLDVAAWRRRTAGLDAKIEGDWAAHRLVSASLDTDLDDAGHAALNGPLPPAVADLMSDAQQDLAGALLVPLADVTLLGPIAARKWEPEGDGGIAAELWEVDDLRFLEISVVTADPENAQEQLLERAADAGVKVDDGDPKTTTVLRYLAGRAHVPSSRR